MALVADLVRSEVVAPGTSSVWTDETTYGGGNPARGAIALWLTAYKMDENQVATALAVTTFDPETVTTFTTENTIDGWYRYLFIIVNYWSNGTTYNQYDVVWDHATLAFYEYINPTPSSGNAVSDITYFNPIPDPTIVVVNAGTSLASNNIIYQVIDKVVTFQTSLCNIRAASKHAIETCGSNDCGCDSRIGKYWHKIRDLFANMPINEATQQFIQGERNARLAQKWCDDCGCLTQ